MITITTITTITKSISLLATAALMISSMVIIVEQYVNASSSSGFDCNSVVGCYANGYELGKETGAEDVLEGRDHDSKCPPNDSISFCTGYKTGCEIGWIAQKTLLD